jgi:hypothetical protein
MQILRTLCFIFLCTTLFGATHAMQPQVTPQDQIHALSELLCCLQLNNTPPDIGPLIIKPMILLYANHYFEHAFKIKELYSDSFSLSKLLLQFCNDLLNFDERFMPYQELGTLLSSFLEKKEKSLITLADGYKRSVLHFIADSPKEPVSIRALKIILAAIGDNAHLLVLMQNYWKQTALDIPAYYGHSSFAQILLNAPGVNPHKLVMIQNDNKETALHIAANWDRKFIVQTLLNTPGINAHELVMVQNVKGNTALECAQKKQHQAIIDLLLPYVKHNNQ